MPRGSAIDRLRKLQERYIRELSTKDLEALDDHLGGPYQEVNPRFGTKELSDEMNRIIMDAPRISEDMLTYRGTTLNRAVPARDYPITTTSDTGHSMPYAESWLGMDPKDHALHLDIEVPRGSPGLSISEDLYEELFDNVMPFGDEMEVILPKGRLERLRRLAEEIDEHDMKMIRELRRYVPDRKNRGGLAQVGELMWQ